MASLEGGGPPSAPTKPGRSAIGSQGKSNKRAPFPAWTLVSVIPVMIRVSEPAYCRAFDSAHVLAKLPEEPFILFVGALQPHKRIGRLLSAYSRLNSPPPLVVTGHDVARQSDVLPSG